MLIELNDAERELMIEALISHKTHFELGETIDVRNLMNKIKSCKGVGNANRSN
jgi:hypothetical protein